MASFDTGWLSPSANNGGWTNQANAYAQDGANATGTAAGGGETPYTGWYNFVGLAAALAAAGATAIEGIEVRAYIRASVAIDYSYLFIGNAPSGTPQSVTSYGLVPPVSPAAFAYVTIGGPTVLWGGVDTDANNTFNRNWLVSDFDANFGVTGAWAGSTTISLDHIQVKVYFTAPAATVTRRLMTMGYGF